MVLYVALGIAAIGLVGMTLAFNRLIDLEFTQFPEEWVSDGKPEGGKASRQEASFLWSGFSGWSCFHHWMFKSPDWVVGNREAETLLFRMRLWGAVFTAGLLVLIGGASPL